MKVDVRSSKLLLSYIQAAPLVTSAVPSRPVPSRSRPVPSRSVPSRSVPFRPVEHPEVNPTKSCTSRAALAGLDLDPIQSFAEPRFAGFGGPGENSRRYSNAMPQSGMAP